MTCQHCQTWILDGDHRCHRCGRRVRNSPARISPATFPIAGSATARAWDFMPASEPEELAAASIDGGQSAPGQQALFSTPLAERRVIPFDSLTNPNERHAIHLRIAEADRPSPVKNTTVESQKIRAKRNTSRNQSQLDFGGRPENSTLSQSRMLCDAPVAPIFIRVEAALLDGLLMAMGCGVAAAIFLAMGGTVSADRHLLAYLAAAILTVPLSYKLLWAFAGQDSPGTRALALELVDFDGRKPTRAKRFGRLAGSVLSLLAAGVGMVWALVDEEKLTWHDHISSTFPTLSPEN